MLIQHAAGIPLQRHCPNDYAQCIDSNDVAADVPKARCLICCTDYEFGVSKIVCFYVALNVASKKRAVDTTN
jgi:hypothetical protein